MEVIGEESASNEGDDEQESDQESKEKSLQSVHHQSLERDDLSKIEARDESSFLASVPSDTSSPAIDQLKSIAEILVSPTKPHQAVAKVSYTPLTHASTGQARDKQLQESRAQEENLKDDCLN